ncbi:MAG: type I-B CRISPR-associated protein Cas8b1/Cst1 [Bacillus thermozeamaize]|uniref:Type I-B CRISPR-associated protein Cas8b1/Cst1 n=1 Tax=Bacillus thermozeamaize TaxID=230954 RepID=A0A1Y3PTS3_9BACI|nr:MAG: type I-B CRISPR-associated protein Cas8b1/Cst1 [Bacillus thermozeamaize]
MKIRVDMGDWMLTMGLIGLCRIVEFGLKEGHIPEDASTLVRKHRTGVEIDTDALVYLPKAFFHYMLDEYSIAEREKERLTEQLKWAGREEYFSNALSAVKKLINDNTKKIVKYFPGEVAQRLEKVQERLKSVKKLEHLEELRQCTEEFLRVLEREPVDQKLTLNYFKAAVMNSFFGQVSFLNVSKNALDLQGHIEEFHKDYIRPVLLETGLSECLQHAQSPDELLSYLNEHADYGPFRSLKRKMKKLSLEKMRSYLQEDMPKCSLIPGQIAFNNFEEMTFSPLGVSRNKAYNFHWNLDIGQPVPISSLAKLVLFCAPAGGAVYTRRDGSLEQGEYRTYVGFVQTDSTFEDILRRNNAFKNHKDRQDPFDKIISTLIEDVRKESQFVVNHLFFIEFSSDYQSKKTLMDYYHLPKYLARYFHEHGKKLDDIWPFDFREQFVRAVLYGLDPKHVIFQQIKRQVAEGSRSATNIYVATRERHRIMQYKRQSGEGVKDMKQQDKLVYSLYRSGREIRQVYEQAERTRGEGEPYAASASKKITGLAYRLLNAVKSGNQKAFMDSLFRLHMSVDKPINPVFLNALHEKDVDFATVGNAFVAGLLSTDFGKEGEVAVEEEITHE